MAAGIVLGGTGSDTGGSIRGPASLCGIAGIKPTYGLVSRRGVIPLAHSLDTVGPMAWTAEDCALLLQPLLGHDPADPSCLDRPPADVVSPLRDGVRALRVGIVRHFHETDIAVSPAVAQAVETAASAFAAEGAVVRDIRLPGLYEFNAAGWLVMGPEVFSVHAEWLATRYREYGEILRERLVLCGLISTADHLAAQRRRRLLNAAVAEAMRDCDLLLCAAAASEAPLIEAVPKFAGLETLNLTYPFNLSGQPAMVVCAGFGEGGLPVGVQLAGRPFEDALVLRAGYALDRALGTRERRPAI